MKLNGKVCAMMMIFLSIISFGFSSQEQIRVDITEFVNQTIRYNPLSPQNGSWTDPNEQLEDLTITGFINITNRNTENITISDLYVYFNNITRTSTPVLYSGRNGSMSNDSTEYIIHVFELEAGESSVWRYTVNASQAHSPLNVTSSYSESKILAGQNITVIDTIQNVFDVPSHKPIDCVYNIRFNQTTVPVNFSGTFYDFSFNGSTINASDNNSFTNFSLDNQNMYWDLRNGSCLNLSQEEQIEYVIHAPFNIPKTQEYDMVHSILSYTINNTISHLRVNFMTGIASEGISIQEEKQIVQPAHPVLYGSNVTWNATGHLVSSTNITYQLNEFTMWVAQRNGVAGDPNTIDNDTISNATLLYNLTPGALVNSTLPWSSPAWFFNYSDLPSPILYSKARFSIHNDGVQLINRTFTRNEHDLYIKELYIIMGYWLDIRKNITSLGSNQYNIRIDVHNKGNQVTPGDSVVTVYDFVPQEFNITSALAYQSSPWYTTASANFSVNGSYNGTLLQWGIIPSNSLNTSFAQGPSSNINTTWYVEFNVTGEGEYDLLDVFITGLDPQKVDGASASRQVFVSEFVDKFKSTEGIFAVIASLMLVLGLVV